MYAIFMPLINVCTSLFITYAIIRSTTTGAGDVEKTVRVSFAFYFPMWLMFGFLFTTGIYSDTPMKDKKSGMR